MQSIAESKLSAGALWQPDRTHDFAHATATAAQPAAYGHPTRRTGGVGAELKWPRIDRRRLTE